MLTEFSDGYYRAQMNIQVVERGPVIERGLYDLINRRIYDTTNAPITMRLGLNRGTRFTPMAENGVPTDVLGLPAALLDDSDVYQGTDTANVFVLKPAHAYRFHQTMDAQADYCYSEDGDCDPYTTGDTYARR